MIFHLKALWIYVHYLQAIKTPYLSWNAIIACYRGLFADINMLISSTCCWCTQNMQIFFFLLSFTTASVHGHFHKLWMTKDRCWPRREDVKSCEMVPSRIDVIRIIQVRTTYQCLMHEAAAVLTNASYPAPRCAVLSSCMQACTALLCSKSTVEFWPCEEYVFVLLS